MAEISILHVVIASSSSTAKARAADRALIGDDDDEHGLKIKDNLEPVTWPTIEMQLAYSSFAALIRFPMRCH